MRGFISFEFEVHASRPRAGQAWHGRAGVHAQEQAGGVGQRRSAGRQTAKIQEGPRREQHLKLSGRSRRQRGSGGGRTRERHSSGRRSRGDSVQQGRRGSKRFLIRPQHTEAAPHACRNSRTRTQPSTPTREQGGDTAWRVLSWCWSLKDDGFLAKSHIPILPASAGRAGRADQINRSLGPSRVQRTHTYRGPMTGSSAPAIPLIGLRTFPVTQNRTGQNYPLFCYGIKFPS